MNDYLIQFALLRERAFRELHNRELYRSLLVCTALGGNYAESRELYENILNEHPYCGYAWFNLGWACLELDATDDALEAFEYAYITQPYFEEAYRAYAELATQQGLYRQALQCYAEMTANVEADSDILARMGECHLHLGDIHAAKKMCRRSLQLDPYNADAYFHLGASFLADNDHRSAARWLREAVRTDDSREEFHQTLATVYQRAGQYARALHHYWRAIEIAPENPASWLQLAELLLYSGELSEAREVLEQARENAPATDLIYCHAACLFLAGERPAAVLALQQALSTDISRHTELFRWAPALREDMEVQHLVSRFQ